MESDLLTKLNEKCENSSKNIFHQFYNDKKTLLREQKKRHYESNQNDQPQKIQKISQEEHMNGLSGSLSSSIIAIDTISEKEPVPELVQEKEPIVSHIDAQQVASSIHSFLQSRITPLQTSKPGWNKIVTQPQKNNHAEIGSSSLKTYSYLPPTPPVPLLTSPVLPLSAHKFSSVNVMASVIVEKNIAVRSIVFSQKGTSCVLLTNNAKFAYFTQEENGYFNVLHDFISTVFPTKGNRSFVVFTKVISS